MVQEKTRLEPGEGAGTNPVSSAPTEKERSLEPGRRFRGGAEPTSRLLAAGELGVTELAQGSAWIVATKCGELEASRTAELVSLGLEGHF